jgi:hypothetical protein
MGILGQYFCYFGQPSLYKLTDPYFNGFKAPSFIAGAGLRQERLSTQAGYCCPDKTNWFVKTA